MPTKRAVLAELIAEELRASVDYYELQVADRRVKAQLVDALAGARSARLDEILGDLYRDRLKELYRAFGLDDSGRKKVDLIARLLAPTGATRSDKVAGPPAASRSAGDASSPPEEVLSVAQLEQYLWSAADILRGSDRLAATTRTTSSRLLFLKRLSDRFAEEVERARRRRREPRRSPSDRPRRARVLRAGPRRAGAEIVRGRR